MFTKPTPKPNDASIAQKGAKLFGALFGEKAPGGNQRRDSRDPVAGEVIVVRLNVPEGQDNKMRVFIRDLSTGGCGLWSRTSIEAGSTLLIIFQGPDGEPVQRTGTVRHCRGQEGTGFAIGVQFDRDKK